MRRISWTLVFNTRTEATALKLLVRVRRRLEVEMTNVWLLPWGPSGEQYAGTFFTACSEDTTVVAAALELAGRLGSIWTVVLPEEGCPRDGVALEAWVPREYRRSMEGLAEASLTVRQDDGSIEPALEPARIRTLGDLAVNVVTRKR